MSDALAISHNVSSIYDNATIGDWAFDASSESVLHAVAGTAQGTLLLVFDLSTYAWSLTGHDDAMSDSRWDASWITANDGVFWAVDNESGETWTFDSVGKGTYRYSAPRYGRLDGATCNRFVQR